MQEAGDKLVGKLPPSWHTQRAETYAHVAICVKGHFEQSYKEIPDEKMQVIDYIDYLVENPS